MEQMRAHIEDEISATGEKEYYHALIDLFDKGFGEMFGHTIAAELQPNEIPQSITILAAGAGHFDALALLTLFPNANILVTDIDQKHIADSQAYWDSLVLQSINHPQLHQMLQKARVTFAVKDATKPEEFAEQADVVIVRNPDTTNSPAAHIINTACAITKSGGHIFATALGFQERFIIMARFADQINKVKPKVERDNPQIPFYDNPDNKGDTAILIAQKQ